MKEGLEKNETIKILKFNSCKINEKGAKVLAELIKKKKWQELYLKYNEIGNKGVSYIFDSLRNDQHMKIISLDANKILNEGMKFIFDSLKFNDTLKVISLEENNLVESGYKELIELLKINHSLVKVINSRLRKHQKFLDYFFHINYYISQSPCWSLDNHNSFGVEFEEVLKTFLLCQNVFLKDLRYLRIPKPILHKIFNLAAINFLIHLKPKPEANNRKRKFRI